MTKYPSFAAIVASCLSATAFTTTCLAAPEPLTTTAKKPKNVVFIIVDDLRPKLGCYGDPVAISPNLDALAKESTLFTRAYDQYPVCGPSRASFLSGMRPDSTGVYGNDISPTRALAKSMVLNRYFTKLGFEVAGFGKVYHDGDGPKEGAWTRPFVQSKWLDYIRPENKAVGDLWFTPKHRKDQKIPSSWEAEDVPDDAYCDGMVAREAVKTLKDFAVQKKPFMMVVGFRHPHLPWCAPKKYWDLYDRKSLPTATNPHFPEGAPEVALNHFGELWSYANTPQDVPLTEALQKQSVHGYYACMSYADAQVGKVIAELKALNLYDDTVIVLISDNGYHLGDNGNWCKEVNWEATNRIVLMLRAPGKGTPGQVVDRMVELVDVYPTLCAASGVPIPGHCEGTSLLPLVDDPKAPWSNIVFNQFKRGDVMGRSIRTDRYRFTLWEGSDGNLAGRELYDQLKDPQGNVNLADHPDQKARVAELTSLLREKWPKSHLSPETAKMLKKAREEKDAPPKE